MTTIDTHPDAAGAAAADATGRSGVESFFAGLAAWVTTTDHKRIGRLYLGVGLIGLLGLSLLGALLGLERADAGIVDENALLQLFQAYRVGVVFAALIPLGLGLSIAIVPLQLGARSIAFPRLALTGFYAWLGGLALTAASLIGNGGMGGGDADGVGLFLTGHGLMILGLLASAGCVATSVLTTRAPGMTMRRVPLFAWSALVGALGSLLALPVAFGAVIYTYLDVRYAQLNFGGAEGIADWIGWMFTVPAVVVFALPALGVAAELVPVSFGARQALRGVTYAGLALVGIVVALAATTQQYVFDWTWDTGQTFGDLVADLVPYLIFAGLPLLGVVIVMGLGALTAKDGEGRPTISGAFVFGFLGLAMVGAGIAGNALLAITDLDLVGTTFEEGATLYVVYGSALGVLGGVAFWAPKLWGRSLPDAMTLPLALLGVGGTVLAALPLYIAGFTDQLGGVPASEAQVQMLLAVDDEIWMILSLIGHLLVALTVLAFAGLMVAKLTGDPDADDNPAGGQTIEWSTSSPAPATNYEHVPTVGSAEPVLDLADEGSTT